MSGGSPVAGVPRRIAPKELNVFDLEGILERWFTMRNSRDLDALLHQLKQHVTWKNAARASVLAEYCDLFMMFATVTPQGVLPAKKLSLAITACHNRRAVNFSSKDTAIFADDLSGLLRAGMSKFRNIALEPETRRRSFATATETEKQRIEEVLEAMHVEVAPYTTPPLQTCTAMVSFSGSVASGVTDASLEFQTFDSVGDFLDKFSSKMQLVGNKQEVQQLGSDVQRSLSEGSLLSIASTEAYTTNAEVRGACVDGLWAALPPKRLSRFCTHNKRNQCEGVRPFSDL